MPKYDKLPRKKKKAVKKAAGLQGKKTTKKEVISLANKEAQKQKRNAATLRRYNENKKYLESLNIPTNIITKSTSIKETKKRAEKYLAEHAKNERQYKQANLVARKINRLIDAGFTHEEATKIVGSFWRPASDKKIAEIIHEKTRPPINENIPLKGKNYLYVGVCEIKDGFTIPNLHLLSLEDIKDFLDSNLGKAAKEPDGSPNFSSVFQYKYGSKSNMEYRAKVFYDRGYNMNVEHLKLTPERYQKITVSNAWSERDFFSMFYTCTCQMKNSDIIDFNDYLKDYCNSNGYPFMDDYPYLGVTRKK